MLSSMLFECGAHLRHITERLAELVDATSQDAPGTLLERSRGEHRFGGGHPPRGRPRVAPPVCDRRPARLRPTSAVRTSAPVPTPDGCTKLTTAKPSFGLGSKLGLAVVTFPGGG